MHAGLAAVRFELSTLPEQKGISTMVIRIIRLPTPIERRKLAMVPAPAEGGLLWMDSLRDVKPWSRNMDSMMNLAQPLKFLVTKSKKHHYSEERITLAIGLTFNLGLNCAVSTCAISADPPRPFSPSLPHAADFSNSIFRL